ncbi:MAG TPA: CDP-diacylglycerol--glycerol-3-phosphate 3-phosphatidyltransferase, partial [Asticcacaulis sp.]|nr:CDP-diacylglycerol--glycerol-3-phosphate 3-phosphatidyltransferase [Asticcacaulis sp.]
MTGENVNPIPNLLTGVRLVFGVVIFILLAGMAGGIPFLNAQSDMLFSMQRWSVYIFIIAALTDLF